MQFHATRLAPSPTGALHLGHARTFLITWWLARQSNARIYMRMEDLDQTRAKPESIQQAYDDLHWLGLDWDPYQSQSETTQSHRLPLYRQALEQLWQQDQIYPCTCSRAHIAAAVDHAASAPHADDPNPRYPGTCAHRTRAALHHADLDQAAKQLVAPVCWRLRVPSTPITFTDQLAGPQSINLADHPGDFPLTRFDNTPAYQLACVVDDHAMQIDFVIRGDDLLPSTPRQIALYHVVGWNPPQFAHVPLVIGPDGKRLAKRHGESRIAQFRAAKVPPEKIVGWAAWRAGQIPSPKEISAAELLPRFDPAKIPKHPIILTGEDLHWLT